MEFKKINSIIYTFYFCRQNGYQFEIKSMGDKFYVCAQNFNVKLEQVDCRIPTYLTAWDNTYFDTI